MSPKQIIEQLTAAHDAANTVFTILSDVYEQLRAANDFCGEGEDETEVTVQGLAEAAEELETSLFDLIENMSVVTGRIRGESSLNSLKYPLMS